MTARQVNGPDGAAKQAVEAVNNPNTQMKEKLMVDRTFKLYERLGEDERVELGEYPSRAAAQDRIERSVQTICHMDEIEEVQRMEFPLDDTLIVQFSGNTPNKVYEIEETVSTRVTPEIRHFPGLPIPVTRTGDHALQQYKVDMTIDPVDGALIHLTAGRNWTAWVDCGDPMHPVAARSLAAELIRQADLADQEAEK